MGDRRTSTGCLEQSAYCCDCAWVYHNQKNGLALGAKHHDGTGHEVHIEITRLVCYGGKDEDDEAKQDG